MPTIPIRIETLSDEDPGIRLRQLNQILRFTHAEIGAYWWKNLLPEHFQPGAETKFLYAPRKPNYEARKRRMGITQPLTWSGALRRALRRKPVINATASRTTVHLVGPSYFRIRYRSASRPNLGKEVAQVNADHERQLDGEAERAFTVKLRELRAKRTHKAR